MRIVGTDSLGQHVAHAHGFQTAAAVAQGQLGFDAVVLFIIDVAGQDEEVGFFRFTEAKQSLQGGEGGLAQKAGQMFALGRFAGKAEKGRVQMQVRRVDLTSNAHGKPRVVPDRRLPRRGARGFCRAACAGPAAKPYGYAGGHNLDFFNTYDKRADNAAQGRGSLCGCFLE